MLLLTQGDRAIGERLEAELALVDSLLAAELVSELPCVNSLVEHLERYRGKMLRPTLVLATGMAQSASGMDVTQPHRVIAAVAEMVHLATLVHDDVLDEAQTRRRGATINHLKGNETAVMLGDYLISHAYHLCSSLDDTTASRIIADTTNTICEGELLQLANSHNHSLDERTYFDIIGRKTASLCGTCCRLGSMLSGASQDTAQDLYGYGEKVGVAFQIVDDVLDLVGTEHTVGKTLGLDLQKGKLTLPLIHFLTTADRPKRRQLLDLLPSNNGHGDHAGETAQTAPSDADHDRSARIGELLASHESVAYASGWASRLIGEAKASLGQLADSPAKALLMDMADAVVTREF